ncbi:MAG: NAD(P)/FAD-dependent oxidoreductase [Bacteroidetes bacterium]|nr:NAD(P)/FAD-dependent oxidoreductase [Bacteroidota bacterium]
MKTHKATVTIIGAGAAGTVASAFLNKQGIDVVIIEKSKFPRFIIGESLLPKSMEHFEEVDLIDVLKEQNYTVKKGAVFIKEGQEFQLEFCDKSVEGWDWTWQVPRAHFDKVLADEVVKRGVKIFYESTLIRADLSKKQASLVFEKDGENHLVKTDFIIDCSGFGNALPKLLGYDVIKKEDGNSSLFTHAADNKRMHDKAPTQISFEVCKRDLWFWVIPFSDNTTSIGFVGNQKYFDGESGNDLQNMIKKYCVRFKERFQEDELLFDPHYMKTFTQKAEAPLYGDNFVLCGNNIEFLDPVFSSGLALSTETTLLAAKQVFKHLAGEKVDWEKEYIKPIVDGVAIYKTYVDDWYSGDLQKLFFVDNPNPQFKKQLTSVLAGYVWDEANPFVVKHATIVKTLAKLIDGKKN